ncbi:unnamed protein product [Rangifer tarandus platyrhynchus]|uniref:Uncharacterized protein n=1 Tax=Rangifer tarandus platyrhynchus TaxID=3082113 RepID=A0ABN8YCF9_RANTA|nr:unnamed protein product [Rangifer tarandus platyrhynchus]
MWLCASLTSFFQKHCEVGLSSPLHRWKTEVYEGRVVSGLHPSGWYSQAHNGLSFCCTSCLRVKAWAGAKGAAVDLGGGDFTPQRQGGGNAVRGPAGTRSEGWGEPSMRGDGGGGGSEGRSGASGSAAAQEGPPPPPAAGVGGGEVGGGKVGPGPRVRLSSSCQPARPAPVGAWHESEMDWEGCWGKGWAGQKCPVTSHLGSLALGLPGGPSAWFWRGTRSPDGTRRQLRPSGVGLCPQHLA